MINLKRTNLNRNESLTVANVGNKIQINSFTTVEDKWKSCLVRNSSNISNLFPHIHDEFFEAARHIYEFLYPNYRSSRISTRPKRGTIKTYTNASSDVVNSFLYMVDMIPKDSSDTNNSISNSTSVHLMIEEGSNCLLSARTRKCLR